MEKTISFGNNSAQWPKLEVKGSLVDFKNERYYKIANVDRMRPFFISLVSDSNHWMFLSSNGGLTAGRKDSDHALFPYYTDDKITEGFETTGVKTIIRVHGQDKIRVWRPFSDRMKGIYSIRRNLLKNALGNKIVFEEINEELQLTLRYQWATSNLYGFVKTTELINLGEEDQRVEILDGLTNVLPSGLGSDMQNARSNLVDAYKKAELEKPSNLGVFALSAIIVDRAEPSEALRANSVWTDRMDVQQVLLSARQMEGYAFGEALKEEREVRGEKGAYLIHFETALGAGATDQWKIVANVNQSSSGIIGLTESLRDPEGLAKAVEADVQLGSEQLTKIVAYSDGLQKTQDEIFNLRHYANTLFNLMRGGIFDDAYWIEKKDFLNYLSKANAELYARKKQVLDILPERFQLEYIKTLAQGDELTPFKRLTYEYLPLMFSRRHGDPSRPWNKFSINTRSEIDGSRVLDYQGNWRDIFQNWEALALSYPEFNENMIFKFLNATTFEGYNPYRVTKDGFDWEVIEPHDPWSYIGYWGDHQVIYLLKFLELSEKYYPGKIEELFGRDWFVYANVPYRIKPYKEVRQDPKDTITFDEEEDLRIREKRKELGADGALLYDQQGDLVQVGFAEKIMAMVLSKLSNFIPDAGIWLNTQRPEWNDANNALVGNGVSMVTLYYLHRFLKFFKALTARLSAKEVVLSEELVDFFSGLEEVFQNYKPEVEKGFSKALRAQMMDALGETAGNYRNNIYADGFSGRKISLSLDRIQAFFALAQEYLQHSIRSNKRTDGLYQAYNTISIEEDAVAVGHLDLMLEGQVAVLSADHLTTSEAVNLLEALRNSALYRPDQNSYILYPDKDLGLFTQKNTVEPAEVEKIGLLKELQALNRTDLLEKDVLGNFHFRPSFRNAAILNAAMAQLPKEFQNLVQSDGNQVLALYERVFNHKSFTGRSGTFFAYEGLGSIYWHMVSKLLLAVQENFFKALATAAQLEGEQSLEDIDRLKKAYYEIRDGIGAHKEPSLYGAFPIDPYSHTPAHKGAQQPGMTGQVKEDLICRWGELGLLVEEGSIRFDPALLMKEEFLSEETEFFYVNQQHLMREIGLKSGELAYSFCQVPIVYIIGARPEIEVETRGGNKKQIDGLSLDFETSQAIFQRSEEVTSLRVTLPSNQKV